MTAEPDQPFALHLAAARSNRYAYPDAPKPIHPDKEQFCSSDIETGNTSRMTSATTFAGMCHRSNGNSYFLVRICAHRAGPPERRSAPTLLVEMDGIEPTTPCLQSRCSTN